MYKTFSIHIYTVTAGAKTFDFNILVVSPGKTFSRDPVCLPACTKWKTNELFAVLHQGPPVLSYPECLNTAHCAVSLFAKQAVTSWPRSRSSWTEEGNGKEACVVAKSWSGARKAGSQFFTNTKRFSTFRQDTELFIHMKHKITIMINI